MEKSERKNLVVDEIHGRYSQNGQYGLYWLTNQTMADFDNFSYGFCCRLLAEMESVDLVELLEWLFLTVDSELPDFQQMEIQKSAGKSS